MKLSKLLMVLCISVCSFLSSCSKDHDGGYEKTNNKENEVVFKVYSNTLGVPIHLTGGKEGVLTIKDYYEARVVTKDWIAGITARCKDLDVLITLQIYVNGKLKVEKSGNGYVELSIKLKS